MAIRTHNRRRWWPLLVSASLAAAAVIPASSGHATQASNPSGSAAVQTSSSSSQSVSAVSSTMFEPYFSERMSEWTKAAIPQGKAEVVVQGSAISGQSGTTARPGTYEGRSNALIWQNELEGWIEYRINVPETGLYELNMSYFPFQNIDPVSGRKREVRRPAVFSVSIDGQYPFREARAIQFPRQWQDVMPIRKDEKGDDIRPKSIEIAEWLERPFRDSEGAYTMPLQWYLQKGERTIRLTGSESIVIGSLKLAKPQRPADYETVAKSYPAARPTPDAQPIVIEAENIHVKNDSAIQMESHQDPAMSPRAYGYNVFNSIGGLRWFRGGQAATWRFEVPESGRYSIAVRALQQFTSNKSTFRNIYIDGKIPFKEFEAFRFPYQRGWKGVTLGSGPDQPYEVYLEKGVHTLSMESTHAPFKPIIYGLEQASLMLREIDQDLKFLTGFRESNKNDPIDRNRTWLATRDYPELPGKLEKLKVYIQQLELNMIEANGNRNDVSNGMRNAVKDLEGILRYANEIPYKMKQITSLQDKIASFRIQLEQQHLQLDQIYIVPSGAKMPNLEASFWQKVAGSAHNFYMSFVRKEDLTQLDETALNVWMNRGRDYVNLLQEMADDMFTPEHGIKVKVNLIPREDLLILSNAAGIVPDVALGINQDKAVDFAIRNALQDLREFKDFGDIEKQFAPGALVPFYYDKGYYALPESQSFQVLFYRKDIMQQLKLKVPDTWSDVYDMLPTLQQNGYNFFTPPQAFIPYLFQNGGEFYTADGMKSALDTPEAFKGFKQWTDNFLIYGMPREVPSFYEHFRRGTIPIGVADYNLYVQLMVAAPELNGWWDIAPIPGIKQKDGTVARWAAGGQQAGMIYKQSEKKELAWEFLKWWISADVQERFGSDLEAYYGPAFRWNTANVEAFVKLPWKRSEANVILQQWKWYKEQVNLPGGYFTTREINNAWNRAVINANKENPRTSLETAIVDINRELLRKQREFGLIDENGNVLRTVDVPIITKPWEGVDRFVTK